LLQDKGQLANVRKEEEREASESSGCATILETVEAGYVKKCKYLILA
jgi:hypothetical protein